MQFNTGTDDFARPPAAPSGSDIAGKLVQWGLVSTRQEASYVLIAVAVLAVLVASYFLFFGGSGSDVPPLLPQ
jgi:hypothetical protein